MTTVAALMGDARLDAPQTLITTFQETLHKAGMMDVNGQKLAENLSKGEIQVIIERIKKTKSNEERAELAAKLRELLYRRGGGKNND